MLLTTPSQATTIARPMETAVPTAATLNPKLPPTCNIIIPGWGRKLNVGTVRQGYPNYQREPGWDWGEGSRAWSVCRARNQAKGISAAQEAAMFGAAFFGWDSPESDPDNYDVLGKPIIELRTLDW